MKLIKNDNANIKMIGAVLGLLLTLGIGILVAYNIIASIDSVALDRAFGESDPSPNSAWNTTDAQNATNATLSQMSTFFTIAPIIAIVVVAVVILGYVSRIGGGGGG